MLKLNKVNKFYNKGSSNEIHVINDISLEIEDRGMVAIFGRSGCGKTSLLNAIGGLDKYDNGEVLIDGEKVNPKNTNLRNKNIGYIFQNYNLILEQTIFENVAMALRLCGVKDEELIKDLVYKALKNVGMENFIHRQCNTLSGGQMQRVAIARALVKNPKVILADEPTGNLDEINTIMIMDLLNEIAKEHLVILVTHEGELVKHYCDKVIVLSDGKVVNVKENEEKKGYVFKDKNNIYIDEYEKQELLEDGNVNVTYYGAKSDKKINIRLINKNGKLYLDVSDSEVRFLDETSEVKIVKGIFNENEEQEEVSNFEFEEISVPEDKYEGKVGKMYNLKSAIKSGYITNFKLNKRKNMFLRIMMIIFGALLVFITAWSGTAIRNIKNLNASYNHETFYGYTYSNDIGQTMLDLVNVPEACVDYTVLSGDYNPNCESISFSIHNFETVTIDSLFFEYGISGIYLPDGLLKDRALIYGKKTNLKDNEVVISEEAANQLIAKSPYGFVKEAKDLLGLKTNYYGIEMSVCGIVKGNDAVVYLNEFIYIQSAIRLYDVTIDDSINNGECHIDYYGPSEEGANNYLNTKFKYNGIELTITEVNYCDQSVYEYVTYYVNKTDYVSFAHSYVKDADSYNNPTVLIHSTNPEKTEEYLKNTLYLSDDDYSSPSMAREDNKSMVLASIIASVIVFVIFFVLTVLCVFFALRFSIMLRRKEVGISLAIGVDRRNLLFKFTVEVLVIVSMTSLFGFLGATLLLQYILSSGGLLNQVLYYPIWLALALIVLIYVFSLALGIIPAYNLIKKTPSEILAKYDI